MSDVTGAPSDGQYESGIDPLFSEAFNAVHSVEDKEKPGENEPEAGAAGGGNEAPTAPAEGAGAAAADAEPPAEGTGTDKDPFGEYAGLPGLTPREPAKPADKVGEGDGKQPVADGTGAASTDSSAEPVKPSHAELTPFYATAAIAMQSNTEASFKRAALAEVTEALGDRYNEILNSTPYMLATTDVPSLTEAGETVKLRDSTEAREYQETVKHLRDQEVESRVKDKIEKARPAMSVLQDSVQMFQSNKDLDPRAAEFDAELADKVTTIGKNYELRIDGKLFGYTVNLQPLINDFRTELAAKRAAAGGQPKQPANAQKQQQAAEQPRTPTGQFDGPQAGIPSKAGAVGEGAENYDTFWNSALGLPSGGMRI